MTNKAVDNAPRVQKSYSNYLIHFFCHSLMFKRSRLFKDDISLARTCTVRLQIVRLQFLVSINAAYEYTARKLQDTPSHSILTDILHQMQQQASSASGHPPVCSEAPFC